MSILREYFVIVALTLLLMLGVGVIMIPIILAWTAFGPLAGAAVFIFISIPAFILVYSKVLDSA